MMYDGLRVVDLTRGIAGAYCAKLLTDLGADVVFVDPVTDPLSVYLRTSQHHAPDPTAWLAAADVVIAGEAVPSGAAAPLVTVSITPVGHGGPDDGLELTEPVLQARSGSLSNHGHMGRPPLTVGGNLGEYVTGAFAALGAASAWWRASRTAVPETVDVSMLEAMQMTFVTTPTVMARFPGGRMVSARWVMIPGNEPTADGRYVGITTVTAAQWLTLCGLVGREDLRSDDELTTMMGRGRRADEVNSIVQGWTRAHDAEEVVAACVAARVPATIVGNGAELPRFEQLVARDVFVPQPDETWIRPRAPFRFHGVPDRALSAPAAAATPWPARAASRAEREPAGCPAARGREGARFHRVLGRSVRNRVAGRTRCGRDQGRGRATSGRHPLQRRGAAAPRPVLLREVRAVPCVEPGQARDHARSRPSRRPRDRGASRRA